MNIIVFSVLLYFLTTAKNEKTKQNKTKPQNKTNKQGNRNRFFTYPCHNNNDVKVVGLSLSTMIFLNSDF